MNTDPASSPSGRQKPRRNRSSGMPWLWAGVGLAAAGVIGLFVVQAWLESYLKSEAFRLKAEATIGKALRAEASLFPLQREASVVSSEALSLSGRPEAAFRSARLQGIRAELDLKALWSRTWRVSHLDLQRLEITLNPPREPSGGSAKGVPAPAPTADASAAEGAPVGQAGPGATPLPGWITQLLPNRTEIALLRTDRATLSRGDLQVLNARLSASPASAGWDLALENGELRHPALPGTDLNEARLNVRSGSGALRRGRVLFKTGGQASLTGEWSPEGMEFHSELENVTAEPFLPKWWQTRLRGAFSGNLTLKQVAGRAEVLSGSLRMSGGKLEQLPVLSQLDSFIGTPRFRQVPLKNASVRFTRSGVRTELRDLDLDADGILRVQGTLVVDNGRLDGRMRLGIPPSLIQWLPGARTQLFGESRDGYVWTPFTLSGTMDEPVEDLSARLASALVETVTEAAKKLPANVPQALPEAAKGIIDSVKSLLPGR